MKNFTLLLFVMMMVACSSPEKPGQETFATPEDAVVALVDAARAGDTARMSVIFGPDGQVLLSSGDPVMDRNAIQVFVTAYDERAQLIEENEELILLTGNEEWPFPIPLIKDGESWRFDVVAGAEEVLFRRIGNNELSIINVCKAYVDAQHDYAKKPHDGRAVGAYAQKIASTPGKQDGLHWQTSDSEDPSPLGSLVAQAVAKGYPQPGEKSVPFLGYYFRVLTAQGENAEGGARDYVNQDEMRDGFGLIAFPAEYGNSGIMTFIVNQDGIVFQNDLGLDTAGIAAEIMGFDPDPTWKRI